MSEVKVVTKNLAGLEDFAIGVGTAQQARAGSVVEVSKVRVPKAVTSTAELGPISSSIYQYAVVVTPLGEVTYYVYSATDNTGVPSTSGPGSWLEEKPKNIENLINTIVDEVVENRITWVTPEDFGAVGDGVTDDIAAINAAVGTGKEVRFRAGANYKINSTIILPYSDKPQNLYGNNCTITASTHFCMFSQKLIDGSVVLETNNKNFYDIKGVGTGHAKSIYTQVLASQFLKISNGKAINCSAVSFNNGLSVMGNARVVNFYADDIRNAGLRGEGENNLVIGCIFGWVAGDVVLIKSNYSYYGNLYCQNAGVSPADTEEPPSLMDQGAMVSFAQDGQNAIGNIVDNCHCLNYGGAFAVFSGSFNKMTGKLSGGSFVEARRAKGAGNAIYMSGTSNYIADVHLDFVYSGVEMHIGAVKCSMGNIVIDAKSGFGLYAISTNGTTTDCIIDRLHVKRGLSKSGDAFIGSDGTRIGELILENFSAPTSGQSPVRLLSACVIDKLYVSQSSGSTTTFVNVTIQAATQVNNLHIVGCLGTSLIVNDEIVPILDNVVISPRNTSTISPIVLTSATGTAERTIGTLTIRGGGAIGQPRANGKIRIGSYHGPSWARFDSAVVGIAAYPDPVNHTLA